MRNRWLWQSLLTAVVLSLAAVAAPAQKDASKSLACNDNWSNGRLENHCEIREQTLASTGSIDVDARKNGGVVVKGWDRNEVFVRSRVQTSAPTQAEAEALSKQILVQTSGARIQAEGPSARQDYHWSVSYEIFVPHRSNLTLEAHNGGIVIANVTGKMDFTALNGGVVLKNCGGNVKGATTNGGLIVELTGDRWDGEALDVRTTNGGVIISMPANYSARLETSTVNGNLSIDFPVSIQGKTKEIAVDLGGGGPLVRATTTNGGVKVKKIGFDESKL